MRSAEEAADVFSREERKLLLLLKTALTGKPDLKKRNNSGKPDNINYEKLIATAQAHQVLPLLYDVLEADVTEKASGGIGVYRSVWQQAARQTVSQNYHLLFTAKFLTGLLREAGVPAVLLKGNATAAYYPVPELRKSSDVDLYLLEEGDLPEVRSVFLKHGMTVKEEQHSLHHLVMQTAEGIVVELHTLIAEPFDNAGMNDYLEKCRAVFAAHTEEKKVMGVTLQVLSGACHAYELLLHMLQHFLQSGFGLKLLCDWVVFWNEGLPGEEQLLYEKLITESGLRGFSDAVTGVCVEYLGLPEEKVNFMQTERRGKKAEVPEAKTGTAEQSLYADFLRDVLDSGEFGKISADRMVAVRGNGPGAYMREFHHQMHLNFPVAGRCCLLWPLLWCVTLVRFLKNNRKIRHISVKAVLRSAGKRGRLVKSLSLFEK